MLAGEMAI